MRALPVRMGELFGGGRRQPETAWLIPDSCEAADQPVFSLQGGVVALHIAPSLQQILLDSRWLFVSIAFVSQTAFPPVQSLATSKLLDGSVESRWLTQGANPGRSLNCVPQARSSRPVFWRPRVFQLL